MKYKDIRQTENYAKYMEMIGWDVGKIKGNYYFRKNILWLGTVVKIQRPEVRIEKDDLSEIFKLGINYLLIEPKNSEDQEYYQKTLGLKNSGSPSLPSRTIQIDLTYSSEKLLSEMHHKTRYNIGLAQRKKVRVETSSDIETFAREWQTNAKERGMYLSLRKEIKSIYHAFGKNAQILFAYKNKDILGGILVLHASKVSYYMYAFSTKLGKNLFAPSLLVWRALEMSKKRGSKFFDFEGVYDERFPLARWKGFSRFKESLGGKVLEYPGPLSKFTFYL